MVNNMPYGEHTEAGANSGSVINGKAIDILHNQPNMDAELMKGFMYQERDVGIKNPCNRSRLKIYEGGDVELFSGDAAGVLINSQFKTTNLYGQAVNLNTPLIRMNTQPNGLMWNDWYLNPKLYQISDKLNPRYWTGEKGSPLPGPAYMDDLKLSASARWWCPGNPNLCGRHEEPGEHHSGHWVGVQMSITPFYRAWDDVEYRKQLDELGIPV
jgi:hypothetical protein